MPGDENAVRTFLTLDSNALRELHEISAGMARVQAAADGGGEALSRAGDAIGDKWAVAKGTIAAQIVMATLGAIKDEVAKVGEFIEKTLIESFDAGLGEMAGRRQIVSALLTGGGGARGGMDLLGSQAIVLKDRIEDVGVQAGVTDEELTQVFSDIAARSNKSADGVRQLTDNMAFAGRALPGGPQALGEGFAAMEQGVVRARNPVVAMIVATGELHGNAKQVAAQLQRMAPDKAIEVGEKAVAKMADRMKGLPPTFEQASTSLKGLRDQAEEALGLPLVAAIQPAMQSLVQSLVDNKFAIESFMRGTGADVAEFINDSVQMARRIGFEFQKDADTWKAAWEDIRTLSKGVGADLLDAIHMAVGEFSKMVHFAEDVKNKFLGAARSGSLGSEAMMHVRLSDEREAAKGQFAAAGSAYGSEGQEAYKRAREAHDEAERQLSATAEAIAKFNEPMDDLAKRAEQSSYKLTEAVVHTDVGEFKRQWDEAAKHHEDGAQVYMAKVLASSAAMQEALVKGGEMSGDLGKLYSLMGQSSDPATRNAADHFGDLITGKGLKVDKQGPQNFVFTGPINIVQDFKDKDPDQILVMFKRDLSKSAVSRVQARVASPFGF